MVVNLSRGGACVEAVSPLRPGHSVDIRLMLPDWQWHGEAHVLRCHVSALPHQEKVRYRAGLEFVAPGSGGGAEPAVQLPAPPGG